MDTVMANILIAAGFLIAGIIHLLPLIGVLGAERLNSLYGLSISGGDLELLMRHRAVLFGILGLILCSAAFMPGLRFVALIAGLLSVISFLALAWGMPEYGAGIRQIVLADYIALAALALSAIAMALR